MPVLSPFFLCVDESFLLVPNVACGLRVYFSKGVNARGVRVGMCESLIIKAMRRAET